MPSWSKTLEIERRGALVLDAVLGREFLIVPATQAHQRQKVDRFLIKRDAVVVHIADYKVDEVASDTGNLALEHASVVRNGKVQAIGWLFVTPADWLVFYVPGRDTAYILLTQALRDAWPDILRVFSVRETATPAENGYSRAAYTTRFIPVPIGWLRQHALIHREQSAIGAQLRLNLRSPRPGR